MPRPVHFEIHADRPDRAIAFYETVFGWSFTRWDGPMPYWLITTGPSTEPGIDGGLMPREGPAPDATAPVHGYVCTVEVPNLDKTIEVATGAGAVLAVPRMPVPGVGWMAYVKDTEGNLLGLMERDERAA